MITRNVIGSPGKRSLARRRPRRFHVRHAGRSQDDLGLGHMLHGLLAPVIHVATAAELLLSLQAAVQISQLHLFALPADEALAIGANQEAVAIGVPLPVIAQSIGLAVDQVYDALSQATPEHFAHGRQHLVQMIGLRRRGHGTRTPDGLSGAQTKLQRSNRIAVLALDQQQRGQVVTAAVHGPQAGSVGLASMRRIAQRRPIVHDQGPSVTGLPPLSGDLMQRLNQARKRHTIVVEETPSRLNRGQSGTLGGGWTEAGSQRAGGMEVLLHQDSVPIPQPRFHRGRKESIPLIL
jgi:hypothetical protein